MTTTEGPFSIVLVCTGNICRSPLAEWALARGLGDGIRIRLSSGGTGAVAGMTVPPATVQVAHEAGLTPREHAARRLDAATVRTSDLLLAMTREHRAQVARLVPAAARRTFTLREFARLAAPPDEVDERELGGIASEESRLRHGVLIAAGRRGSVPLVPAEDDDVVDPYGRPVEVHRRAADQIIPAVETVAAFLRTVASAGS